MENVSDKNNQQESMEVDEISTPIMTSAPPFPSPTKSHHHHHTPRAATRLQKNFDQLHIRTTSPVANPKEVGAKFFTEELDPEELQPLWSTASNKIPEELKKRRRQKALEDTPELLNKLDVVWGIKNRLRPNHSEEPSIHSENAFTYFAGKIKEMNEKMIGVPEDQNNELRSLRCHYMSMLKLVIDARIQKARQKEGTSSNAANDVIIIDQNATGNISNGIDIAMDDNASSETNSVGASKQRGRPKKQKSRGGGRPSAGVRAQILKRIATTIPTNARQSRQITLTKKHQKKIDERMAQVHAYFHSRPDPIEQKRQKKGQQIPRCRGDDDDCPSFEQCELNAQAFDAANKYIETQKKRGKEFEEQIFYKDKFEKLNGRPTQRCHKDESEDKKHIKCAAISANHRVDYYSSGRFGDALCKYCGDKMLLAQFKKCEHGKQTPCCQNGEVHTQEMQKEYEELQNPPADFITNLVGANDKKKREAFLNNTIPLNNSFAFASVHSEKAPLTQTGGRADTIKLNGQFSFCFSDLVAPQGQRPKFAQVYTLEPEDALNLRDKNFCGTLRGNVRAAILAELETLMRNSPFGQAFVTAGDKIKEAELNSSGNIPRFQITLLTDREMKTDAIQNRGDCTIVERADAPTAKQIAVIWVSEEGVAPDVQGVWIRDQAGRMTEMKSWMPQLNGACFPILHPKSTPGWRSFIKKNRGSKPRKNGQEQLEYDIGMQRQVDVDGENFVDDDTNRPLDRDEVQGDDESSSEDEGHEIMEQQPANSADIESISKQMKEPRNNRSRDNITERPFYRYRYSIRVNKDRGDDGKNQFHWLWFARRLAELFIISTQNLIERRTLDYQKELQMKNPKRKFIAKEFRDALQQALYRKNGGKLGKIFQMNKAFPGSTAYYQEKYSDLMSIVRHLGNPTWFVTFTGNPKWPEIVEALQEGQEYTHRPDIVCKIFMDKAEQFIKEIVQKEILGKVGAWCYSIEHQKRGMPHIHFLLILDHDHKIMTPEQVNEFVVARVPPLPAQYDFSIEAMQDRRLWHNVTSCMLHDCNAACGGDTGICRKFFPKEFSKNTVLSTERYAQYRRLDPEPEEEIGVENDDDEVEWSQTGPDFEHHSQIKYRRLEPPAIEKVKNYDKEGLIYWKYKRGRGGGSFIPMADDRVIPYNPYLLLRFGCHINIEYVFGQKACKYIFKYILKGFEKAYVKVVQKGGVGADGKDIYDYDEPAAYFKVRFMTAMEAFMRTYGHKIVNMSHQIYQLTVHEPDGQNIILDGDPVLNVDQLEKETRLTGFFKLCRGDSFARTLRYDQVPYYYSWNIKDNEWKKRRHPKKEDPSEANMFVRIYHVSPKRPELLAIRTLLMHRVGPQSFEDLRTVDGVVYSTFMEAAQKLGLLDSDDLFVGAMEDACNQIGSRTRLQHYFAMLLCHACPADPAKLLEQFVDKMFPAPAVNNAQGQNQQPLSRDYRRASILRNIEYYLRTQGTSCAKMGIIGLPADYDHDRQAAIIEGKTLEDDFYGDRDRGESRQKIALDAIAKLNDDQNAAFEEVKNALSEDNRGQKLFFLEGGGGTGKTFFYNTLTRWCLAGKPTENDDLTTNSELRKGSVITAASTGIASLLLIGGSTAHSQFYVPNDVDAKTTPRINYESVGAQRFRDAELIIIDEVGMLHKDVSNYIDRLLRDVCNLDKPFGGKVVLYGGDWRQLTPVVPGASRQEQVEASIKMDTLFKENFKTLRLTKNMRAKQNEVELCEWLKKVGRGMEYGKRSGKLSIPKANQSACLDEIMDFCFPPGLFERPLDFSDFICQAALLCPRNEDVDAINNFAIEKMAGELHKIESIDQPLKQSMLTTRNDVFKADNTIESIHRETPSGFPPHVLKLKVGAPVMLLRNLDTRQGLCNGTRLQVLKITDGNLKCRILTGPRAGTEVFLPRIKFEVGGGRNHRGFCFQRIQFPVRLCFAMTVNKAQGQTLQRMGLILDRQQCFSHGQVYVALSRVTTMDGIRVLSPYRGDPANNEMDIENIVYYELLDDPPPAVSRQSANNVTNGPPMDVDDENEEVNFDDYFD